MIASDGLPDDRVTCTTCRHCLPEEFRCRELGRGQLITLPRRCMQYLPLRSESDQRTGVQRWPRLTISINEARAAEKEAEK